MISQSTRMGNNRIRLLTPEEYDRIVKEGRAAEVLQIYVRQRGGRRPIGDSPKSGAERQRDFRARQRAKREGRGGDQ